MTWLCMVINVISSNLETKFIEGTELNLYLEPVSTLIIPPLCLNIYERGNQVFSDLLFFSVIWNRLDNILQLFSVYWLLSTCTFRKLSTHLDLDFQKSRFLLSLINRQLTLENPNASLVFFLLWNPGVKRCLKVKNYEVKIRIKNHDLRKARISNKTINLNLHKVRKLTKINCRELSTVTSTFLDIRGFKKRER